MNISYRWLTALAPDLEVTPQEVADRLAMYGAPVDEIVALGEPIADVIVGRVVSVRKHPNADRLSLCEVDAGAGEPLQVVCGAPNVRADAFYPFAPVGASLPGGIKIRKAKIRGETSNGMLCSERELGLGRSHEGLMELHGTFTPGEPFAPALGLDDVRFVVDVTPNRPELLSHYGVARELAPGGRAGVRLPEVLTDEAARAALDALTFRADAREAAGDGVRVVIEDPRGCWRYMGVVVRGVTVGPSPEWLAARLRAIGVRPINNVVDATNYVLHELGQPLHAFDLAKVGGAEVRVRRAHAGEPITTLDGVERTLSEDMLVIADADRPIAVAGVMGGEESEVTSETRDILLECALFDPKITRRTRRALGLSTDASYRYERGVDPEGLDRAARRALELILATAGGEVAGEGADVEPEPWKAPVVEMRVARAARILGTEFTSEQMASYLEPIGFDIVEADDEVLRVRVPGYRWYDVEREADLIEEVARRHGYDNFDDTLRSYRPTSVPEDPLTSFEGRLREFFVARGFHEARTAAFAPEAHGDVGPLNPLSQAEARLRRALAPGLLRQVEHNFARSVRHVRLFEIGTVFAPSDSPVDPPRESTHLAAVLTGARVPPHWSGETPTFDVWDVKAIAESLVSEFGGGALRVEPAEEAPVVGFAAAPAFRIVDEAGSPIGAAGLVAADAVDAPAWADPVWALEVRLEPRFAARRSPRYRPAPAFPAVDRDAALLVPDALPAATVQALAAEAGGAVLESVHPFDLYRGTGVPEGTRSIAFRLRFRAPDRTLTDEEVDNVFARVLRRLKEELGVERRV